MAQLAQMRSGPTPADLELAQAASALAGRPISAWQIKRWREAGLLRTTREFRGRGRGSGPISYPPRSAAHAVCLDAALERRMTLDEACLVCFLRGFSPRERALKRAYSNEYARLARWFERAAPGARGPLEVADAVGRLLSRRSAGLPKLRAAKARIRAAGKPASDLAAVLTNVVGAMLGGPVAINRETLNAFGMGGLRTPFGLNNEVLLATNDLGLNSFSLPALVRGVADSTLAGLEQARADFLMLREVALRFASVLVRMYGLQLEELAQLENDHLLATLFAIPAVLITRRALGEERFATNLEILRGELPRLRAMQQLLDELPADFYPYLRKGAAAVAALSNSELEPFRREIRRYFAAHPTHLALLTDVEERSDTNED